MKVLRLWIGLVGAPFAWLVQVMLSQSMTSYLCYPHNAPLATPLWRHLPWAVIGINIACLFFGLFASRIVAIAWRKEQHHLKNREEHIIEAGENRQGFLIMIGALSSAIFVLAILFTACAIFLVSPCGSWL